MGNSIKHARKKAFILLKVELTLPPGLPSLTPLGLEVRSSTN
ncbi:hypothetical protein [Methanosarcina sp. DH2]|nr:hypothetical protein [Methanosarcina sp. DH2]